MVLVSQPEPRTKAFCREHLSAGGPVIAEFEGVGCSAMMSFATDDGVVILFPDHSAANLEHPS